MSRTSPELPGHRPRSDQNSQNPDRMRTRAMSLRHSLEARAPVNLLPGQVDAIELGADHRRHLAHLDGLTVGSSHPMAEWSGNALSAGVELCSRGETGSLHFRRKEPMPIYISRGKFTTDAVKGMLAKAENREEAVANLFKSCGGKLIGWYLTLGRHDWLVIGEFPDEQSALSAVLAAAAGGSLSDVETTLAMTAKDAAATFEASGKAARGFRSAGRS